MSCDPEAIRLRMTSITCLSSLRNLGLTQRHECGRRLFGKRRETRGRTRQGNGMHTKCVIYTHDDVTVKSTLLGLGFVLLLFLILFGFAFVNLITNLAISRKRAS